MKQGDAVAVVVHADEETSASVTDGKVDAAATSSGRDAEIAPPAPEPAPALEPAPSPALEPAVSAARLPPTSEPLPPISELSPASGVPSPSPVPARDEVVRCLPTATIQQWYGSILNSYFARWLGVGSLAVAALDSLALLVLLCLGPSSTRCGAAMRSVAWLHHVALPSVLFALPVLSSSPLFRLYERRGTRMHRLPYLQLCEVVAASEMLFLVFFTLFQFRHAISVRNACHGEWGASERVLICSGVLLWIVLGWQIIVFCRFLAHLQLQADCAADTTHPDSRDALDRVRWWPCTTQRARRVTAVKRRLCRAVASGNVEHLHEALLQGALECEVASLASLYREPRLWLGCMAWSARNPLHLAAKRGDVAMTRVLLDHGFDVNARDKVERLHLQLSMVFETLRHLLVKTQDDPQSTHCSTWCSILKSALHIAVQGGHVRVVQLLLERGAHVDTRLRGSFLCRGPRSPAIFWADDVRVIRLLVTHGANFLHVERVNLPGCIARTAATAVQTSAFSQRAATTDELIANGADVALTPLHAAAAAGDASRVTALLYPSQRAQVDVRGERVTGVLQRTPLHWAAIMGRVETAGVLLEHGAEADARDARGQTPLHWAARNNHADVVALLLNYGANPRVQDAAGMPVLSFAAHADHLSATVVHRLCRKGASLHYALSDTGDTPLHIALACENRTSAKALIECGADMKHRNAAGVRAMDCASSTKLQLDMLQEAGTRDLMLSYLHATVSLASRVRGHLEQECRLTCWMDTMGPNGIAGGAVWREEIGRGIRNCSLVLCLICRGYGQSEWCLKELALARLLAKPVLALVVDARELRVSPALAALVPRHARVPFHEFVTGATRDGELAIDETKLQAAWHRVVPRIRAALTSERAIEQDEDLCAAAPLVSGSTDMDDQTDENKRARTVLLYSPRHDSAMRYRLNADLQRLGWRTRVLPTDVDRSGDLTEQLERGRVLVVLLEDMDSSASKESSTTKTKSSKPNSAAARLTALLDAAQHAIPRMSIVPVLVHSNCLAYSHLYTLSRIDLLYLVEGISQAQVMAKLVRVLRGARRGRADTRG